MEVITSMQDVCRVASAHDPVNNSECCYTFHTPFTKSILVNLRSFTATCEEMSMLFEDKKAIFVRISKARVEKTPKSNESSSEAVGDDAAPTKLAIGVEGGFPLEDDKFQIISKHSVVVMERNEQGEPKILAEMEYSEATKNDFPEQIVRSVDSILQHAGVALQQDVKAWSSEDEVIPVSKYANDLPFVENGVLIDPNPSAWKCQKSGESENLWLNLSDGYIGGGRKNWDGSGGSNGAIDHYHETGDKYPLVVKLGTITADLETADCYSYAPDEDGPVKVPNLAQLLEKRGIKIANL
jgi:ubiquitin carboxyl-terminal hydrolase 5/13